MAEDVKPEVIKKTQDILGKFIKKPVLTEKLLKKPPFRFLHDICTSVMKETGFFEGTLNGAEDKIENIKDKDGKIAFLQKVIGVVEAANDCKLSLRPNKVVAGLEATKTNEFLQALGKAIEKQKQEAKNSKVSQPSKTKSTKKPSKEIKEEPPDKKKSSSRNSKKLIENGVHETNDSRSNNDSKTSGNQISPTKTHSSKKTEESVPMDNRLENEKPEEKIINNGYVTKKSSPEKREERHRREKSNNYYGAGESTDLPDVDYVKVNGVDGQGDQNMNAKEELVDMKKVPSGKHKHRRPSVHAVIEQAKVTEHQESNENETNGIMESQGDKSTVEKHNTPNKTESILKEQNRKTPSPSGQPNYSKKDTNFVKDGPLISRPRTGIRPTTARPASARPAAPRIRDRGDVAVMEEVIKPVAGKVQVIEDKEVNNEAEDENLISLETINDIILEEPSPIAQPIVASTQQGEHGHLVEQILEAQKELESDAQLSLNEQKPIGKTEIEWEFSRNKEAANREIEKLRSSIQTLTRSANPLGKLLDFFQEDVDTVQKELEAWKGKNASLCVQIAHEKSITDQFVEPLKIHLKELQQSIDEQLEQINIVKANIIRNNQKIHKLLTGM